MSEMDLNTHHGGMASHSWTMPHKAKLVRHLYFLNLLKDLDREFCLKRIPIWIIKGPALAYRYYSVPTERLYTDIDLFVEPQNWEKSLAILKELGGKPQAGKKWMGNAFRAIFLFDDFPVEIHKSLLVDRPIDYSFIKDSRPTLIPDLKWFREPGPEDLFVYLCGHGAFQHLFDEIQWLYDLNLFLFKERDTFSWEKLRSRTKALRLRNAVGVSLVLLERYFGHQIPADNPIGMWFLRKTAPRYLHPERIRKHQHRKPYPFYLFYKALMRESFSEAFVYGLKRLFK